MIDSSLRVSAAAALPELAKAVGARLVIINWEPTALDPIAGLVVQGEIGGALEAYLNGYRRDPVRSDEEI